MGTATDPEASTDPAPAADPPEPELKPGADDTAKARREAANYRKQLRDAEVARDAALERVSRMQRTDVELRLAGKLADPTDFWAGNELGGLVDDAGEIDGAKVDAAVAALLTAKPHYAPGPKAGPLPGGRGAPGPAAVPATLGGLMQSVVRGGDTGE
jgi:hypothetical protein